MEEVTIPLVGPVTGRRASTVASLGKDQRFIDVFPSISRNPVTNSANVFLEKRPGWQDAGGPGSGINNDFIYDPTIGLIGAYSADESPTTDSTLYLFSTGSVGVTSDCIRRLTGIKLGSTGYVMASTLGTTGWFLASDSYANTSYTCDGNNSTTITDIKVSGVNSVAGLYVGQKLTAASNIVAGSRIVSIDSATFSAVLDTATTGGAFNDLATTKEPISKIVDADFPTDVVSRFVEMDGYVFCLTSSGRIYNSDPNNPASWSASNYITCNTSGDAGVALEKVGKYIIAFGTLGTEIFENAGNPSGSPLSRVSSFDIGAFDQESVTKINGQIFWVCRNVSGRQAVYTLEGLSPKKISDAGSERRMAYYGPSQTNKFHVTGMYWEGMTILVLIVYRKNTGSGGAVVHDALYYCPEFGLWGEFGPITAPSTSFNYFFNIAVDQSVTGSPSVYCADKISSAGVYYVFSNGVYTDSDNGFTATVQTSKTDFGTDDLKSVWEVALMGSDIQSSGTATLEYSDDDYGTWTTAGTFDLTKINPRITRCGAFRGGRAWRITHLANTAFRAQALKFKFSKGKH